MRFAQDSAPANSIQSYSGNGVVIQEKSITHSIVVSADSIQDWTPRTMNELTTAHLEQLTDLQPEIVIIGTGREQQFPTPQLLASLQSRGIGVEFMANDAACRTFNILLGEDRRVVVALIMEG